MITRFTDVIRLPVGVFPRLQRRTAFVALTVLPSVSCISGQVAGLGLRFLSLGLAEHCSAGITADVLGVFRKFFPAISASMLSFQLVTLLLLSGFFLFSSAPLPCASLIPLVSHRAFVAEGSAVDRIRILLVALRTTVSGFVIRIDFSFCHGLLSNVAGMAGFGPACTGVKIPCLTAWRHPRVSQYRRRNGSRNPTPRQGTPELARVATPRPHLRLRLPQPPPLSRNFSALRPHRSHPFLH